MSASQYRGQLDRKRKQRIDADKKAGEYRSKESSKRADAAKAVRVPWSGGVSGIGVA
ncbi:hypothetical protein [Actinomyces sp.]|uniref:hypothetical protein n=1 Tax=Actinomyces sp. TaxID=29317 RepID=UPI00289930AF|nr:hypothetical protein [Actinomyces sp.]